VIYTIRKKGSTQHSNQKERNEMLATSAMQFLVGKGRGTHDDDSP